MSLPRWLDNFNAAHTRLIARATIARTHVYTCYDSADPRYLRAKYTRAVTPPCSQCRRDVIVGYSGQQPLVHTSRSDRGAKCVGRANTRAKDRRFIARIDHRGWTAARVSRARARASVHRETNKKHIRCANQVFYARSVFIRLRSLPDSRRDAAMYHFHKSLARLFCIHLTRLRRIYVGNVHAEYYKFPFLTLSLRA